MDRGKYNTCISPYIKGTGKTKEQRKLDFCIGAKVCSGKVPTREEAEKLCSLPKEPRPTKERKGRKPQTCEKDMLKLTQCVMNYFDSNQTYKQILNVNSIGTEIMNALIECQCQK